MTKRAWFTFLGAALAVAACGPSPRGDTEPAEATPPEAARPTVTVDGRTTTVSNRDAGAWGGAATLLEQTSIGSATGEEAYLLGAITSIAANDELIALTDLQARKVRVYDLSGAHLRDIGGEGSGPGEFRRPWQVGFTDDGRLLVRDQAQRRLHAFTPEGELLDDWLTDRGNRSLITTDGGVFNLQEPIFPDDNGEVVINVRRFDPTGRGGDWEPFPARAATGLIREANQLELMAIFLGPGADWRSTMWVPFEARVVAEMTDDGAMVSGRADRYRFEVIRPDGATMVVEKDWQPVTVTRDEADWYKRRLTAQWRAATDESWTWNDAQIPPTKGAYIAILPSIDGRFWVVRETAGEPVAGCNDDPEDYYGYVESPCWRQPLVADLFDEEGGFLGPVPLPAGIVPHVRPYVRGDTVIALIEDAEGTPFVKRYRLRSPS